MCDLSIVEEGLVFRNPKPHVRSVQAYFPSVADLGGGEMLCAMVLGEAFESANCRIHLARSHDYGITWENEGRMLPDASSGEFSESCRLMRCADGNLVVLVFRWDRSRKDEGLANPETLGFTETRIYLSRSTDNGRSWSDLEMIESPLIGPAFELCSPVVEVSDGKWLLPTSTWKSWDGSNPTGMKAVAFVSYDRGISWPEYIDVMDGTRDSIIYWEQKIVELSNGRLLSVAWVYSEDLGSDLCNTYSISTDNGASFSEPLSTGLHGQTPSLLPLSNDQVLCIYRRTDIPGLWAAIASVADGVWDTKCQVALWGAPTTTIGEETANMVKNFNALRFGAPCITRLDNGDIFVTFWCFEDAVSNIRWIRLAQLGVTL